MNVLVSDDWVPKIGGFGFAKQQSETAPISSFENSTRWVAPEAFQCQFLQVIDLPFHEARRFLEYLGRGVSLGLTSSLPVVISSFVQFINFNLCFPSSFLLSRLPMSTASASLSGSSSLVASCRSRTRATSKFFMRCTKHSSSHARCCVE